MRILFSIFFLFLATPALSQLTVAPGNNVTDEYKLKFPAQVDTPAKKILYLYIVQEKIQVEHNTMGQRFTDGVITEQEWLQYKVIYEQKRDLVMAAINQAKDLLKKATDYNPSITLNALAEPK